MQFNPSMINKLNKAIPFLISITKMNRRIAFLAEKTKTKQGANLDMAIESEGNLWLGLTCAGGAGLY